MSRQTSILSFFNKSATKTPPLSANTSFNNNINKDPKATPKKHKFHLYDLVWARLDGFPHWPAIVCNHPSSKKFFKVEKGVEHLNVQFFDSPPQRAWIKVQDCVPFEDSTHPKQAKVTDESLLNSIGWAMEALECPKEERGDKYIVSLKLSDAEDSDGAEAASDVEMSPLNKSLNKSSRIASKRKLDSDSEAEDRIQSTLKKKKKMFAINSDDSEDEYRPGKLDEVTTSSESMISEVMSNEFSDVASFVEDESLLDEDDAPKKSSKANRSMASKSSKTPAKAPKEDADSSVAYGGGCNLGTRKFTHLTYAFLKPENIKDKAGRRPDHPDYDAKTLYIPSEFLKKQTATQRQWWEIKQDHFDTLLFFKMGKFYELFHMDAMVICEVRNILFMKGEFAHAGFPEGGYERHADALIKAGYKVARVEQTESAEARDSRLKQSKGAKVVRRELCRVASIGTRTMYEFKSCEEDPYSAYILAITEKELSDNSVQTGLCFIDTSLGEFHIGQLVDDKYSTLLRTIFAHYTPVEILLEKDQITSQTLQTIKSCLPNVQIQYLKSNSEFWKPRDTLKFLMEAPYFKVKQDDGKLVTQLPEKLKELLDPSDVLNLTVKHEYELSLKAFGAIIYQLKRSLIEEELLAKKKFKTFDTNFLLSNTKNAEKDFMVLDSVTIKNLELLENSEGGKEGTLLHIIDTCKTKFGKRRLRTWICSPLCSKAEIDDRLGAVGQLMELPLSDLHQDLAKLPDLERILFKIHTQSLPHRSKNHPDSRAVFHELVSMNKTKVSDFCKLLESFHRCDQFVNELRRSVGESDSPFLYSLVNYKENGGVFPNMKKVLVYFDNSFDQKVAKEKGVINPKKGVNREYEAAEEAIRAVHKELDNHLRQLSIQFGTQLKYAGTGKNRYQIEFPERLASKIPKDFEKTGSRKGFNKYQDRTVKNLLEQLKQREAEKEESMQDAWRLILQSFMEHSDDWVSIIKIVAILDCLIALANYANSLKSFGAVCRPKILEQEKKVIRFKAGQHPSLLKLVDNFMANDLELDEKLLLLSGANMGGKSTLMRQTGLLTLLAHVGSYVPAELFERTIVDRIFTRLGATDRILEGESTFYVELSETSTIIKHATNKSLILLDELGRGTSSIDGTAIAGSVVDYLSRQIRCPTMFSTHYSNLMEEFKNADNVIMGHMGCVVEQEDLNDPTNETITFLYKLVEGICPKSYGFNAAKLAGVPDDVIRTGFEKAREMESKVESIKLLSKLVNKSLTAKEARLLINYLV